MIYPLTDVPLSAEAKALVAQAYFVGIEPGIVIIIRPKEDMEFN